MHRGLPTQVSAFVEQQRIDGQVTPHATGLQYLHPVTIDVALDRARDRDVVGRNIGDDFGAIGNDQVASDVNVSLNDTLDADTTVGLDIAPEIRVGANGSLECRDGSAGRNLGDGLHLIETRKGR